MAVRLTGQQQRAVSISGNIAVTAGAGTGKTSAMTERVIRVLDGLDRIGELLVATFTDDAAAEIRRRVYQALLARIRATDGAERAKLEAMRDGFLQNHISTMHTFFAHLLRRFPDRLDGVDPDFRVVSGAEQTALLRETVEGVIDGIASAPGAPLRDDLRLWLRQHRRSGVCGCVSVLIRKRVEVDVWLRRMTSDPEGALAENERRADQFTARAREAFFGDEELAELVGTLRGASPLPGGEGDKLALRREAVLNGVAQQDVQALRSALLTKKGGTPSKATLGVKSAWDEEARDEARVALFTIAERLVADDDLAFHWDGALERDAHDALASLARLTATCLDAYRRRKERLGVVDFVDLEDRATALLRDPWVLATLRGQFQAIFIDEFQDTNRHQWGIFRSMAQDAEGVLRPNVLSIVGDEKQAIYEFRGGEVEVCELARRELDHSLEFTANFRSESNLILFTNRFFAPLLGGSEAYEARAQSLTYGDALDPPSQAMPGEGTVTRILDASEDDQGEGDTEDAVEVDDDGARAVEREARAVAELLRGVVDGEREDDYPGLAASIEAGERSVGILFRRTTHQHVYEDALRSYGVPYIASRGRGFYHREEARDLRNLLRLMEDPTQDIPLVGVLRSPLIGCSDAGLLLLATRRDYRYQPLWDVLAGLPSDAELGEAGFSPDDVGALRKAADAIARWRQMSRREPASVVLSRALAESGAYAPYALGVDGRQRVLNVDKFLSIVASLEADGSRTLGDLTRYFDMQDEEGDAEGDADMPEGAAIQLLTVHRAKGLEWPMVIVPDTDARFRTTIDETTGPAGASRPTRLAIGRMPDADEDEPPGVAIRYRTERHKDEKTFAWSRMAEDRKRRGRAEQKRLLYVAFTRAQQHLVIGCCSDRSPKPFDLDDAATWADWIAYVLADGSVCEGAEHFYAEVNPPRELDAADLPARAGADGAFDTTHVWAAPLAADGGSTGIVRVTDEPLLEFPHARAATQSSGEDDWLSAAANGLLPSACEDAPDEQALRAEARRLCRTRGAQADETRAAELVAAVTQAAQWLAERFPGQRLLFNRLFDVSADGVRLVGRVDVVAIAGHGAWTAVDVKYVWDAVYADSGAWEPQAERLRLAMECVSGGPVGDVVRHVVETAS
jgi:ATP-dependent helicase/nuclease subunit A